MNEHAQMIKTGIMLELSKEGKTLQDLEKMLSTKSIDKSAAALFDISKIPDGLKSLVSALGAGAIGVGGALGTGAYSAYLANENSNDLQLKKMRERQQYIDATNSLKADMQNPLKL